MTESVYTSTQSPIPLFLMQWRCR